MTITVEDFTAEYAAKNSSGRWRRLVPLESTSASYLRVEKLFNKGWQHRQKKKPRIFFVFRVISPEGTLQPYFDYRESVQASPSFKSSGKKEVENLFFHGTKRACLLAEDASNVQLCSLRKCAVCSIIRESFDIDKSGSKHKFSRFSRGIYTTSCSSKADDYSSNGNPEAKFKVLVVSRVVVGKPLILRKTAKDMTELPCGYHSVVGEPGEDLNYPETVVFDNDAIRPAYIVVYGEAPEDGSKFKTMISTLFKTPVVS